MFLHLGMTGISCYKISLKTQGLVKTFGLSMASFHQHRLRCKVFSMQCNAMLCCAMLYYTGYILLNIHECLPRLFRG